MDQKSRLPPSIRFATIEVHDIKFAKEIIQQVITNLGDHTKIASIAIDRGFMDGALLRWLNSEDIIFYIPAKSSSVLRHKIRLRLYEISRFALDSGTGLM